MCLPTIVVDQLRSVASMQLADVFERLYGIFDEMSGRGAVGGTEGITRHVKLRSIVESEDRLHQIGQGVVAKI